VSGRAVLIGLDGAAWHLLEPLMDQGAMPHLAAARARGAAGTLTSTIPPVTPPAWTSAATGMNPGRHGIYGFHSGHAQHERQELMHSGKVKSATVWEVANAQGARAGVFNVPLTYPPQAIDGWMVSGMMTPGLGHHLKGFVYPERLEARIADWVPEYVVEMSSNWEQDWRDASLADRALHSIEQRRVVLERLLAEDPVDLLFTVLEAPDRLQHMYYAYMDPAEPLYKSAEAEKLRPRIVDCFTAMDDIIGLLVDYAGSGGVIICSDHGFTAWAMSVHTNALLAQWGYLRLKTGARVMQSGAARALVPLARRFLPTKVRRSAKKKTFAAIDWSKTKAFASPDYLQGIFVNVAGREPYGIVPGSGLDAVKNDLTARFESLRGPDGDAVTDKVWRSEEVFSGDAVDGAPDLLPVLRHHRFELDDELVHRSPFTDQTSLPRGVHHPDGIVVLAGEGVEPGATLHASVMDIAPSLLYMAGLKHPEGLDGTVIADAFVPDHLASVPPATMPPPDRGSRDEESPYSDEEAAIIEESLRGLGYL